MNVFVSSTYADLQEHREAVNNVLTRMRVRFSAMEFFGSRTDEAVPVCKAEIDACTILVGIYAWRYGWQPEPEGSSITEQEFRYARERGKRCLCYLVDPSHPWPPKYIDRGKPAEMLQFFKDEVSNLVRSTFTTPDNLAMQVAADLAREMTPRLPEATFGGLLRINWDIFAPEVQDVLSTAYAQARVESDDGVVATRHVISALAEVPNTAKSLLAAFPKVPIQPLMPNLQKAGVYELFTYDKPISSCVLASMKRLLPQHSPAQRLLAIELGVDILKFGKGESVRPFREAGIEAADVTRTLDQIRKVAKDTNLLREALGILDDAQTLQIAYLIDCIPPSNLFGRALVDEVLELAKQRERVLQLVGELMSRYPQFAEIR